MQSTGVSIIILTKNGAHHLKILLETFFKHNTHDPVELIVIDHGSTDNTDNTADIVANYVNRAMIRLVRKLDRDNFAASCNFGAQKAHYPLLLFLNNDIVYTSDMLPRGVEILEDDTMGVVGCRLDDVPGKNPQKTPQKVQHTGIDFQWDEKKQFHRPIQIRHASLEAAAKAHGGVYPAVTGAFMLCRKADFQKIGGFCEEYDYGFEDIDFCLRVGRDLKKKCFCINGVSLQHLEGATRKQVTNELKTSRHENNDALFNKRMGKYVSLLVSIKVKQSINQIKNWDADQLVLAIYESEFFDSQYYLEQNIDVAEAGVDPALHYLRDGWKQERKPSRYFDTEFFIDYFPDFDQKTNPLLYYLSLCKSEKKCFSQAYYQKNKQITEKEQKELLGINQDISSCKLAIGIVLYNNSDEDIEKLLKSINNSVLSINSICTYICNNGSQLHVKTKKTIKQYKAKIIRDDGNNTGFGAGHNEIMCEAFKNEADVYICANPDGFFHPLCLTRLLQMYMANPGFRIIEAAQLPTEHPHIYNIVTLDISWASGCCLLISKIAWQKTGGFDEGFFMFCEDVDLSWRVRFLKGKVQICPHAYYYHDTSISVAEESGRNNEKRWLMNVESQRYLAFKWGRLDLCKKIEAIIKNKGWAPIKYPDIGKFDDISPKTIFRWKPWRFL